MTNEEALSWVQDRDCVICHKTSCEKCKTSEALYAAEKALEQADKYDWHDLRKNPEDLPKLNEKVLVCGEHHEYEVGTYKGCSLYSDKTIWRWKKNTAKTVIAWKHIEPFRTR